MDVEMVVEIPKGSRNKYEMDHDTGIIWLDRTLFTATQYPADYGFIHPTLGEDGDPLDALVLLDEPTFPGCRIRARVIGVLGMRDDKGWDHKVLCVPATDPRWLEVQELDHLSEHLRAEISHFFEVYKQLEPGKFSETTGWQPRPEAERIVREAFDRAEPHA